MIRQYETVCVFRNADDAFKEGVEAVKAELQKLDGVITKEEDMRVRTLAYRVRKQTQGHYYLFEFDMDPEKAHQIDAALKHRPELLRHIVVRKE